MGQDARCEMEGGKGGDGRVDGYEARSTREREDGVGEAV